MKVLVFGNAGSGKSSYAQTLALLRGNWFVRHCTLLVFLNPGMDACLANNLRRPWEPHKYASLALQNSMLGQLQEWVAGYYERNDAWSYRAHREIFDAFAGPKVEHRELGGYAA